MKRKTPRQQLGPLFTIEDQDCGPLGHAYEKHGRLQVIDRDGGYVGQVPLGSLAAARTMLRQFRSDLAFGSPALTGRVSDISAGNSAAYSMEKNDGEAFKNLHGKNQ